MSQPSFENFSLIQGSGSNCDICVITKKGAEHIRPYDVANEKGVRQGNYMYPLNTTAWLGEPEIKYLPMDGDGQDEAMDTGHTQVTVK